jgi:hypothetical protein
VFDMQINLNLCLPLRFDKKNKSSQCLQVTFHNFSNQICVLTRKIHQVD